MKERILSLFFFTCESHVVTFNTWILNLTTVSVIAKA